EGGDERVLLDVALNDDEILPDDRRAADAPLVVGVVEPAGVQEAKVFLPQQLAVHVVRIEAFRSKRDDDAASIGHRRRRRLTRFRVALRLRNSLVSDTLPEDLARTLVERDQLPGMLRRVFGRFNVAIESGADADVRIAAHRGRDE